MNRLEARRAAYEWLVNQVSMDDWWEDNPEMLEGDMLKVITEGDNVIASLRNKLADLNRRTE